MTWTDISVCTVLTILVANGAHRGFLRALINPLSFIIGTAIAYFLFQTTRNVSITFSVAILGPVLLSWALRSLTYKWFGELPVQLLFISRVGGATVTLLWGGTILALTLLLIALLPFKDQTLDAIRQDMNASKTYQLLEKITIGKNKFPSPTAECPTGACDMNPADLEALSTDQEIQALLADERVQRMINDPLFREAVEKKNMAQLLSNPIVLELAQDPQFLTKVLKVYPKLRIKKPAQP